MVVVIATYNEVETIGDILHSLSNVPVIVVDDSSPDGTGELVRAYGNATLITRPGKLGIASAYITGIQAALEVGADSVVQMDAGGTHRPGDARILDSAAQLYGADLVIGSRFYRRKRTPQAIDGWTFRGGRTLISLGAAFLMRRLGINVRDATSGFRCWSRRILERMDLNAVHAHGFAFQLEMLSLAYRAGAEIIEASIPYRLTNSTFNPGMLREALVTYLRLCHDHHLLDS